MRSHTTWTLALPAVLVLMLGLSMLAPTTMASGQNEDSPIVVSAGGSAYFAMQDNLAQYNYLSYDDGMPVGDGEYRVARNGAVLNETDGIVFAAWKFSNQYAVTQTGEVFSFQNKSSYSIVEPSISADSRGNCETTRLVGTDFCLGNAVHGPFLINQPSPTNNWMEPNIFDLRTGQVIWSGILHGDVFTYGDSNLLWIENQGDENQPDLVIRYISSSQTIPLSLSMPAGMELSSLYSGPNVIGCTLTSTILIPLSYTNSGSSHYGMFFPDITLQEVRILTVPDEAYYCVNDYLFLSGQLTGTTPNNEIIHYDDVSEGISISNQTNSDRYCFHGFVGVDSANNWDPSFFGQVRTDDRSLQDGIKPEPLFHGCSSENGPSAMKHLPTNTYYLLPGQLLGASGGYALVYMGVSYWVWEIGTTEMQPVNFLAEWEGVNSFDVVNGALYINYREAGTDLRLVREEIFLSSVDFSNLSRSPSPSNADNPAGDNFGDGVDGSGSGTSSGNDLTNDLISVGIFSGLLFVFVALQTKHARSLTARINELEEELESWEQSVHQTGSGDFGLGTPAKSETDLERGLMLFPDWSRSQITGYLDDGWTIEQLVEWRKSGAE